MRLLDFSDSFESATEPSQGVLEASVLRVFADDAAFVTDKGTAVAQGDIYSRSSDDVIRYYNGTTWVSLANLSDLTATNISFTPVGTIAASDLQTAVAEVATDAAAALSSHKSDTTSAHGIADTSDLLTTSNTKSVTNKDIDGGTASNTSRITLPKASKATLDALTRKEGTVVYASDTDKLYYDDGSVLKLVGSGSGSGTNFITDGDAEGTQIFTVYNDSSTTRPVDGTDSTQANLAVSISSSSPLAGTNSFLFTKSGSASTQGSGASIPFTVDAAYKAKVLQIEFDYIVNSGTFVAGSSSTESDVIAYIYDVTNSTLIEPSSIKLLSNSTTISDKFVANFQTSATGTSYRLILHCQSTSTANYELKLDNIKISPCQYVYGTPITDWVSYTPTLNSTTSVASRVAYTRRVGDTKEVKGYVAYNGAGAAGSFTVAIDSGAIDTNKLPSGTGDLNAGGGALGELFWEDTGTNYRIASAVYSTTTSVAFVLDSGSSTLDSSAFANGDGVSFKFSVPISGWSSSVQVSDGYDGRQIKFKAGGTPSGTLTTGFNVATFPTVIADTTASHSSGTWTAPTSDYYDVSAGIETNQNWTAGNNLGIQIYANGGSVAMNHTQAPRTTNYALQSKVSANSIYLLAGQTIQIRVYTDGTGGGYSETTSGANYFSISRSSSATTISATEVVAASYRISADKTPSASNPIDYDTKIFDTHNAVTTGSAWKFTAPVQGLYRITTTNGTSTTGGTLDLYVNGSQDRGMMTMTDTSVRSASATVSLLAGGYISINPDSASKTFTGTKNNTIYIERIK